MSALHRSLEDYLAVRRSVGYKLESVARMLSSFVAFAERAGAGTITTELALSWATQPRQASPIWLAHRLSAVRGFARYLHALDPATEVPPADLLAAPGYQPAPPYLYSDADIAGLLAAARRLRPPLQAATFETLLGLLAVTGLRIGEAMRLDRDDIDWDEKSVRGAQLEVRALKGGGLPPAPSKRSGLTAPGGTSSAPGRPRQASSSPSAADGSPTMVSTPPSTSWPAKPAWPSGRAGAPRTCTGSGTPSRSGRCWAGIAMAATCRPACRCYRPTSGTSGRPARSGT